MVKEEAFKESNTEVVNVSDVDELEEDKEPSNQGETRLGPIKLTGKNLF